MGQRSIPYAAPSAHNHACPVRLFDLGHPIDQLRYTQATEEQRLRAECRPTMFDIESQIAELEALRDARARTTPHPADVSRPDDVMRDR